MFAFNEHGVVKNIVNELPKDVHPDLLKLYKEIPPEMTKKVKVHWRIKDDEFIEPAPTGFVGNKNALMAWVKTERNRLLSESDKYMTEDFPGMTPDKKKAMIKYRDALRKLPDNIPESAEDAGDISFPKNPLG